MHKRLRREIALSGESFCITTGNLDDGIDECGATFTKCMALLVLLSSQRQRVSKTFKCPSIRCQVTSGTAQNIINELPLRFIAVCNQKARCGTDISIR
ncbi:hypothetical protein AAG584_21090 [Vreelandella titanicae]|uniref:hypothetical protein n=1 Tax=Vreelandella titanicae TaxID=664683 RepID=UPI00315A728D